MDLLRLQTVLFQAELKWYIWDFAITNSDLADGLTAGAGYGQIANANQDTAGGGDDTDEHMTAFFTYSMSGITAGYQMSQITENTDGGTSEEATGWSIAANIMDGLPVLRWKRNWASNHLLLTLLRIKKVLL